MGHLLTFPPSPFEADHLPFVLASVRYQDAHAGALPDLLAWHRLERRYDLNPERFAAYHPNLSVMIERARQGHESGPGRPDSWPIDRCSPYQADCGCEPRPAHGGGAQQVVPEPAAGVTIAIGLVAVWAWAIATDYFDARR